MLGVCLALIDDESDKRKFEDFVKEYENQMFAVAMSILHNTALAEEAMWDGFYYLAKNFSKIKCEDVHKIRSYCIKSIRDACYRTYNKEKKHFSEVSIDDEKNNLENELEDVNFDEFNDFEKEDLKEALLSLPKEYKDVIIYTYYYNHKSKETAEILDISVRTVFDRLKKAKEALRQKLTGNT